MSAGGYGLGIDIGYSRVAVAACNPDGERCAEPLRPPPLLDVGRIGALLDRVGDPVPLYVDGLPRTAADAVAALVAEVAERAAEQLGAPAAHTVVTVPPSWTDHRRSALADALHGTATLASSAVAVTRHGRATGTVPAAATVAVYDLGASTLDTAVVRADDGDITHVAPPPAPLAWGGRDVDDAVVQHVRGFLPTTPTTLRAACVAAKEALSTQTDVRVEVGERTRPIRLVREDLDELLTDAVAESVAALRAAVSGAGLDPGELDGIVLAGGSARLPAVAEALSAELGRPVLMTTAPELAAACGAAELALDLLDAPVVPTVELAVVADEEPADEDDVLEDEFPEEDEDDYQDEDDEDDELAERRARRRSIGSAAFSRVALVAALFVAILATPVTLLATLDSGILASHGGGAASAADSPAATTPPAPDSPAAATGPAGTTSASRAHGTSARSSSHPTKATNSKSSSTTATGSSTAAVVAAAAAAAATTAPTTAAVVPVDTTTAAADPGTTTPAPVTDPAPVVDPPATDPPVTDPPPSSDPPVTNPPPTTDPPPATNPAPPPPADTPAPPPADPLAVTP